MSSTTETSPSLSVWKYSQSGVEQSLGFSDVGIIAIWSNWSVPALSMIITFVSPFDIMSGSVSSGAGWKLRTATFFRTARQVT